MNRLKPRIMKFLALAAIAAFAVTGLSPQMAIAEGNNMGMKSEVQVNKGVSLGNTAKDGVSLAVPKSAFDKNVTLTLKTLSTSESKILQNKEFDFFGQPVSIKVEEKKSVRLNQPSVITIAIPKGKLVSVKSKDDVYAAYHNGKKWEYFIPDSIDLKTGIVKFKTYHFSTFGAGKLSEKEQIERFSSQMAVKSWAKNNEEKGFINATQTYFKEAFQRLGIKDSQAQGKLLRCIVKENDFGDLLVSLERNDMTAFKTKVAELSGKALVSKIQFDADIFGNVATITSTAAKAAGLLAGGDPTGAQKEIASAMMDYFPAGKAFKAGVEVIDAGIKNWTENELEAAYNAYKYGANGEHGYYVDKGNFSQLVAQMKGISHKIYTDAINEYCEKYGVKVSSLGETTLKKIRKEEEQKLDRNFKQRSAQEAEIQKQKAYHAKVISAFKRLHLLDRGSFGFGYGDNIEDRLQRLYNVMGNIQEMVGTDISIDNMCVLIGTWYNDKTKNKTKFYAELKKMGYPKKSGKAVVAGKEYGWVLKQVVDDDAKEAQTLANNKKPLIYKYDVDYSRGSVLTTMTYMGATDTSTKINGVHPTNGAYVKIKATWSSPPQVIKKDSTVTLNLSVSLAGQSHKWPNANGTVLAQIVAVGKDGVVTGAEKGLFYNKDRKYWFETSITNNYTSFSETVTAKLPGGSTEGEKIAVRVSGGMNGMMTRASYIYTWSVIDGRNN